MKIQMYIIKDPYIKWNTKQYLFLFKTKRQYLYGHFFDRSVYAKDQIVNDLTYLNTCSIKCSECVCVYVKTSNRDYFCGLWKSFLSLYCMEFYRIRQKKNYFQWQRIGQGYLSKKYTKQCMSHKKYGRKLCLFYL